MGLWYQKGHFPPCNRTRGEHQLGMQIRHKKLGDFPSHGFFFLSWKYEANISSGSGVGKEGFSDGHCRTRDSKETRVSRDHEFITTPVICGFSPALQCSATPEKAMSKMELGSVRTEV